MSFVNQSSKESLNSVVDSSVILKSEFQNSINNARNNILKRKGLFPPIETSAELKMLEKNSECDYVMNLINQTILSAVEREKENVGTNIDFKRLKHLRYESLTTCEKFENYKKFLNDVGVNIYVYKNTKNINEIDYKILENNVDVFH
jgi:hypothetical protein